MMINPVKMIKFKDKDFVIQMPFGIENNAMKEHVFLLLILIFFAVSYFCFNDVDLVNYQDIGTFAFIFFVSLLLIYSLVRTIKQGAFVMAADEKGIYYRVFGEKNIFILLEWRNIAEIAEYSSGDSDCIIVKTIIKNYDLPRLCNARTSELVAENYIDISISTPQSLKNSEIKRRLDNLRLKSQNAILV